MSRHRHGRPAFAERLLEEQAVSVIPGEAFGPSARNFVRLGLAQNRRC
jgi:arginine:pyruvate transaminase